MPFNLRSLSDERCDIVTACTSCALTLKHDYPKYLDSGLARSVSGRTFDIIEYLAILNDKGRLNTDFNYIGLNATYHTPCHLKVLGNTLVNERLKIIRLVPGLNLKRAQSGCCGMGGTFGMKKENYDVSIEIGGPLFNKLKETSPDRAVTDCPTCKLQIEQGTGMQVVNPVQIISESYGKINEFIRQG